MTTLIQTQTVSASIDFARVISAFAGKCRAWRLRQASQRRLAGLDDHLRRDIGLIDSGLPRALPRAFQREHEIRFKIWSDR